MDNNINSEQEKPLQTRNKKTVRIEISLSGKRKEIHIGKDVVRLLGVPAYICLKVNKALDSIVVMPCAGKEYMSFKVPEGILQGKNVSMRVNSQPFVGKMLAVNGYKSDRTYQVRGIYLEKNNAVIFNMAELRPVREEAACDE